jgi:hypothetical protein
LKWDGWQVVCLGGGFDFLQFEFSADLVEENADDALKVGLFFGDEPNECRHRQEQKSKPPEILAKQTND